MTIPDNFRSLFALGIFCGVGGAWLTLATGLRTLPIREANVASTAPECRDESTAKSRATPESCAPPAP